MNMSTITKSKVSEQVEEILSKPLILVLHNDDYNTFEWVIECLIKICKHETEQASQCAHIVHFTGKCDVKRGDHDTIMSMYNKLKNCGLTTSIEMA
jgi:ATP-dependent Clp protease adaptor protein ClpS